MGSFSSKPTPAVLPNGSTAPVYKYNNLKDFDLLDTNAIKNIQPQDVNPDLVKMEARSTWPEDKTTAFEDMQVLRQNYRPNFGGGGRRRRKTKKSKKTGKLKRRSERKSKSLKRKK